MINIIMGYALVGVADIANFDVNAINKKIHFKVDFLVNDFISSKMFTHALIGQRFLSFKWDSYQRELNRKMNIHP